MTVLVRTIAHFKLQLCVLLFRVSNESYEDSGAASAQQQGRLLSRISMELSVGDAVVITGGQSE